MDFISEEVLASIERLESELIAFRRRLHKRPELAYQEHETAAAILERLQKLSNIKIESGIAGTGIKVVLNSDASGPVVALRADMDALPITELGELDYRSATDGVMHACGHDGHTTCLLGALIVLSEHVELLNGPVVFIFQPAEELEFGAKQMLEAGVLDLPKVEAIFGLHAWPDIPIGTFAVRAGPVLAGYRDFDIKINGKGTHGAMPEKGVDPIVIAAQIVTALQTITSRSTNPGDQLVVSVGKIVGGESRNVIPDSVQLAGTTRFYDSQVGLYAMSKIEEIVTGVSGAMGGSADVNWIEGSPPVVNATATTDFFKSLFGEGREFESVMASEDFAEYQQHIPGTFWGLGVGHDEVYPLHHPKFNFADAAIRTGVAMHCAIALNYSGLSQSAL